jgi:hypothetical protein
MGLPFPTHQARENICIYGLAGLWLDPGRMWMYPSMVPGIMIEKGESISRARPFQWMIRGSLEQPLQTNPVTSLFL